MTNFITITTLLMSIFFPALMLCITYPFSRKAALFWSDYISSRTARLCFAILKTFCNFSLDADYKSRKNLPEQFVLLSNHQSLLDIVAFFVYFSDKKIRFVAKDALAKAPMVGKMLKSQQHCVIPRKGKIQVAMKNLEVYSKRVLQSKAIPLIFPEGTRSRDGNIGKFHPAGFRKINEVTQLPVVVCAIDGGWQIGNLKQVFCNLKNGKFRVKVVKVYDCPKNKEDEIQLLDEAHALMENQLSEWRK